MALLKKFEGIVSAILMLAFAAGCEPSHFCDAKKLKTFNVITEPQLRVLNEYNRLLFTIPIDTIINYSNNHRWIAEDVSDLARRSRDQFFVVGPNETLVKQLKLFDSLYLSTGSKASYQSVNGYVYFRPSDSTVKFTTFTNVCKDSAITHYLIYQPRPGESLNIELDARVQKKPLMNGWKYIISVVAYRGM